MSIPYPGILKSVRKIRVILCILIFCSPNVHAQYQILADSLEQIYRNGTFEESEKFKILKELAENHTYTEKKLEFSNELIAIAGALDSSQYLYSGYLQKGNALRLKGDLPEALRSYFRATEIAIDEKNDRDLGVVNIAIADVYSIMENHERAINYYQRAIEILREEKDSISLASALLNAGDEYFNYGILDSALTFFAESGEIFNAVNYELGVAYNLGNTGLVYAKMGENLQAEQNIMEAVALLETIGDYYPISVYLTYMSDINLERGEDSIALNFAMKSLDLARKYGLKEQIGDANLKLSELHENKGNIKKSFQYFKDYVTYKDSVNNILSVQQMANLRSDFEIAQKQIEVDLLNEQRRNQRLMIIAAGTSAFLIGMLAIGLFRRNRYIKRTNLIIAEEKNRSENLLQNILPEETAHELMLNGKVQAKKFDSVTVLFTDFKDFTHYAEKLPPEKLVETVDYYFSRFDEIFHKHGIEKIKTVGDAYMCAAGLPFPVDDHAFKMTLAALEIAEFVGETRKNNPNSETRLDIRIGINSGPVVAGVVGTRKFAYDIWGDTVNVAARLESCSSPGKINVSENTYQLIRDRFNFEYRGEIHVRNRGAMKMYFVNGIS
jgi:class 3 adenylate cyclase